MKIFTQDNNLQDYCMKHKQEWISEKSGNLAFQQIKQNFQSLLSQQSQGGKVNYYDFLLIAKKIGFRFEESAHLMALKNYFSKHKNQLPIKRLTQSLLISFSSLIKSQQKIVVKFAVSDIEFDPIHQVTNEDQQNYFSDQESRNANIQPIGVSREQDKQTNQKALIILSIKIEQMLQKINILTLQTEKLNIFSAFDSESTQPINYDLFRKGIITIVNQSRLKIKISEEDVKAIFFFVANNKESFFYADLAILKGTQFHQKMRQFYNARINKDMVKNTVFKIGSSKGSDIQVFQLKNASVLQFKRLEQTIIGNQRTVIKSAPKRIPHFGPLKGPGSIKKPFATQSIRTFSSIQNKNQVDKQRQKIQKILKLHNEQKKNHRKGDTVTSKLRSLFIHKVILPRQKMFEEEKQKLRKINIAENQLSIKPHNK